MVRISHYSVVLQLCILSMLPFAASTASEDIAQWQRAEIQLTRESEQPNPYASLPVEPRAGDASVELRGVSGQAADAALTVIPFWDGGQSWIARFKLPLPGEWRYRVEAPGFVQHGTTGSYLCSPAAKDSRPDLSPIRVNRQGPRKGRYFLRASGAPFLWIGDTWWNWTKEKIRFSSFQTLVDDRAAKGFNVGQLFIPGNAFSPSASLHSDNYETIDTDHAKAVDRMLGYANSKGIAVMVVPWWTKGRSDLDSEIGRDQMKRWWRYVVHRWAAYDVIWCLAGEYNAANYGGLPLSFWKELGELVQSEDLYQHMISIHNTPPTHAGGLAAPQWHTGEVLHREAWMAFNQTQTAHGRWRNEMVPIVIRDAYQKRPAKPIVDTDPWFEFIPEAATAHDVRFAAWSALLSGAAGHTYGGGHIWRAYLPEAPEDPFSVWPYDPSFEDDTLDYAGARSMAVLAKFMLSLDWWRLEPRPELITDYPDPFCASIGDREFVIYLRWGGSPKFDLRNEDPSAAYQATWINPATGAVEATSTYQGGGMRFLKAPEDFPGTVGWRDWLVHLKKITPKS